MDAPIVGRNAPKKITRRAPYFIELIKGGIKHMSKLYKRVGYGSLVAALLTAFGCSTTNEKKPNPGAAASPTPSSQLRSGGQKSQTLNDKNLPGNQDQSSLDALRRGEAATIARDNAMKDVYFDFDQYNLDEDDRA